MSGISLIVKSLSAYPGQTIGERFRSAKKERTFRQLGEEFGVSASSVRSFAYRNLERIQNGHVVRKTPHLNYAGLLNRVVVMLAAEKGITEKAFRKWIKGEGAREFEERCGQMGIELFRCQKES